MRVYVASSKKNPRVTEIMDLARAHGHRVLDWARGSADVDEEKAWTEWYAKTEGYEKWSPAKHVDFMGDPQMLEINERDGSEMRSVDAGIVVLPAGRSAHLEIGWLAGAGVPTCAFFSGPGIDPEPMLHQLDFYTDRVDVLFNWLRGIQNIASL